MNSPFDYVGRWVSDEDVSALPGFCVDDRIVNRSEQPAIGQNHRKVAYLTDIALCHCPRGDASAQ